MAQDPNQQQNFNPDPFAQQFPTPDQNPNNNLGQNPFSTPPQDPFAQQYSGSVNTPPAQNFYAPANEYSQAGYNDPYASPAIASPNLGQDLATDYPNFQSPVPYPAGAATNLQNSTPDSSGYNSNGTNFSNTTTSMPNSFTEKKSGNKAVLLILGIVVAVLIIATGVLIYLNYNRSNSTSSNTNSSSSSSSSISSSDSSSSSTSSSSSSSSALSTTGGTNTPATLARKSSLTQLGSDWILKQFTKPDRDDDGKCVNQNICKETADPDSDGLANVEELNFGSDPLKSDTDGDGISDGDEVSTYYTDPLKTDSDGDTFLDGLELSNCFDPSFVQTTKMGTSRLNQIAVSAGFKPVSSTTVATLRKAGASSTDITRGYVENTCTVLSSSSATNSSAPVSTNLSSTAAGA